MPSHYPRLRSNQTSEFPQAKNLTTADSETPAVRKGYGFPCKFSEMGCLLWWKGGFEFFGYFRLVGEIGYAGASEAPFPYVHGG